MNILVLNYEYPPLGGGAAPVSQEISKYYVKLGHRVDVVTMGYAGLAKNETVEGVSVHRVKCWRSKKEICHPWEQITYLISAYAECKKLIKNKRYDVCHCHFIIPTGQLAYRLKRKFNLKYFITSHGSDVIGYNPRFKILYPLLINSWKKILSNSESISTPSKFLKTKIIERYPKINPDKIISIPNGIENSKFPPLPKEKYILLLSRLFVNKGIQDFIEAIKLLNLNEWKVKIVGEGPYRGTLEKMVKKAKLNNKIKFLGWIDNESNKMKELYGKASIFVLPSYFENMNITLLEAMQAGCAVIASDAGGNTEVVNDAGISYQVGNKVEFREKLVKLLNDSKLRNRMAQKGIQRIHKNFEWDVIINQYIKWLCLVN